MQNNNCYNIIFSSSAFIYGNQKSPIIEASISNNLDISLYFKTKLYIENILNDLYNFNNKWNIIILRYFNPVGYDTRNGTCIKDFIHIDDLVNLHIISLKYIINNKNIFKIYNVETGHDYIIKKLLIILTIY